MSLVSKITAFAQAVGNDIQTLLARKSDWNATVGADNEILNKPTIPTVDDTAYAASWNGNTDAPTKNAVYDKIETLGGGGGSTKRWICYNMSFYATNNISYYFPLTIEAEQTSPQRYNTIIPPFNMQLKTVVVHMRGSTPTSGDLTITLRKQNASGSSFSDVESVTLNYDEDTGGSFDYGTSYAFDFSASALIDIGHPCGIFGENTTDQTWGDIMFSAIFEEQ